MENSRYKIDPKPGINNSIHLEWEDPPVEIQLDVGDVHIWKCHLDEDISDDKVNMILGAVVVMVMLAITIVIAWNVVGSIDTSSLEDTIRENVHGLQEVNDNDAANATWNATLTVGNSTTSITDNMETYYTIAPIMLIVMAAVGILGYIMLLKKQ